MALVAGIAVIAAMVALAAVVAGGGRHRGDNNFASVVHAEGTEEVEETEAKDDDVVEHVARKDCTCKSPCLPDPAIGGASRCRRT